MLLTLEWFSRIKPVVTKCIFFLTKAIESKHAERVVWGQGGFQFEEGRKSEDKRGRRIQEIDKTSKLLQLKVIFLLFSPFSFDFGPTVTTQPSKI